MSGHEQPYSVSLYDLQRRQHKKEKDRWRTFDKILEKCYRRIERAAEMERSECIFEVPQFMWGYPVYDVRNCCAYIMAKIKKKGFKENTYIYPNWIYIRFPLSKGKDFLPLEYGGSSEAPRRQREVRFVEPVRRVDSEPIPKPRKPEATKSISDFQPSGNFLYTSH